MTDYKWDIYLASPFFSSEQKETMNTVSKTIRDRGLTVFDPREHGKIIIDLPTIERPIAAREIFASNVIGVEGSYCMFACIDDKDVGVAWELGASYMISKNQRYYPRISFSGKGYGTNVMLSNSVHTHCKNLTELVIVFNKIARAITTRDKSFLEDYFRDKELAQSTT